MTYAGDSYMDTMTAAFNLVHGYPGGAVTLAPVLGKNPATLSHEVNPNYPGAKLGLEDAVKLSVWSRDRSIVQAFASQLGCMLLPLPDARLNCTSFEAIAAMAKEFGDLVAEVSEAVSDNKVNANELKRVQAEAAQLVACVETTVAHLASMVEKAAERRNVVEFVRD